MNNTTLSNTTYSEFDRKYFFSLFAYEGIVMIPTIFGNILLIYCIKRFKSLHRRSYILVANLSLSDLLFGLIFLPYDMISFFLPEIRENKITCLLRMLLLYGIAIASTLNLLVMSLERYAALTYPIWHLTMSKKWLIASVVASWVVAMLLSALPLFGWNSWDEKVQCVSRWYDPIPSNCLTFLSSINALSLIVSSILFLKVVVTTYAALNQRFGKDDKLGTQPHSSITSKTSIEKTKLYVLMLGLFVVFWGPYCIVVVLKPVLPSHRKQMDEAEKYSSLLALSNSAFNWIIYGLKNRQIRNAFKVALCGCKNGNDSESKGSEANQYTQEESVSRSNTTIEINCVDVSPYI